MKVVHPDAEYVAFLREGKFMIQRSRSTGRHVFYPRLAEPGTGLADLEWVAPSGLGVVYSTTVMRSRPPEPSYNVALIDLDEGPRLMSRVEGLAPEDVTIGLRVRALVQTDGEAPILVFNPA